MTKRRRKFNKQEKIALYLISDGKCEICGAALDRSWHSDHVHPYSKGGVTDIINAQALCPKCNLSKGSKMAASRIANWPDSKKLRDWQENALLRWQNEKSNSFLAVATPGAGKTLFALRLGHQLLEAEIIERLFIVCPTAHLRKQWAVKAHEVGIDIDPTWSGADGPISRDYRGAAITYQMVASGNAQILRRYSLQALVIFDEVHHAGLELPWGNSIHEAFDHVPYRLLLSGTPFRSDNHSIPYVWS